MPAVELSGQALFFHILCIRTAVGLMVSPFSDNFAALHIFASLHGLSTTHILHIESLKHAILSHLLNGLCLSSDRLVCQKFATGFASLKDLFIALDKIICSRFELSNDELGLMLSAVNVQLPSVLLWVIPVEMLKDLLNLFIAWTVRL
ncbi:hypothetical protein F5880DRAFT_1603634 [Lentinula raphanica]|nr:hypothetical protein F5880DRAFT_1603634 [Lentinula raphanica]